MKEISKGTNANLREGEIVVICEGGSEIPCVVSGCENTLCRSCILRKQGDCMQWKSVVRHSLYDFHAAFIPLEDVVE